MSGYFARPNNYLHRDPETGRARVDSPALLRLYMHLPKHRQAAFLARLFRRLGTV